MDFARWRGISDTACYPLWVSSHFPGGRQLGTNRKVLVNAETAQVSTGKNLSDFRQIGPIGENPAIPQILLHLPFVLSAFAGLPDLLVLCRRTQKPF